ncbi:hypothetical protein T4D_5339 [Trichinella pseudospiralis]|nr:hypothetical protein T4D_5339 [Trichinella pseudospiralis]
MENRAMLKKRSAEEAKTIRKFMMKKPQPPTLSHQHPASFYFLEKSGVQCINNGRIAFQDFPEIARILFLHLNLQEQSLGKRFR